MLRAVTHASRPNGCQTIRRRDDWPVDSSTTGIKRGHLLQNLSSNGLLAEEKSYKIVAEPCSCCHEASDELVLANRFRRCDTVVHGGIRSNVELSLTGLVAELSFGER
jgi:hypothetical protein